MLDKQLDKHFATQWVNQEPVQAHQFVPTRYLFAVTDSILADKQVK